MTEPQYFSMKKLTKLDVRNDKSISWIIKYDILQAEEIYRVCIDETKEYDRYSEEILFMRNFNKDNHPYKQYIFNLHTNKVFYIIKQL